MKWNLFAPSSEHLHLMVLYQRIVISLPVSVGGYDADALRTVEIAGSYYDDGVAALDLTVYDEAAGYEDYAEAIENLLELVHT